MPLELWVHDAITGAEVGQVFPLAEGCQWSTNIAGTGESTWVLRTDDDERPLARARILSLFQPNARLIALRWGMSVVGAWKIESWDYADDTKAITISAVELVRSEARWRMTYPLDSYGDLGTLTVTGRSYPGAVRAILIRFMQWAPEWNYPIDLPADGTGSYTQTWEFWKKLTIEDLLVQIEEEGVEIFFRPYLTEARVLRFQTLVAPRVVNGTSSFHLQAEDSPLSGVHYRLSGVEQITGGQGLGEGNGQDQPVRYAGGPPFTIPIRDAKRTFSDLTGTRLQVATNAWFARDSQPVTSWVVEKFTTSDTYSPMHAVSGRGWNLQSKGHPVFPDGIHPVRVVAASGTFGLEITTEVESV